MGKLIYSAITSLDGYVADEAGNFDWAEPDEEVHAFVNDLERPAGTYLYGRKMYETMQGWQTFGTDPGASPVTRDFGELWRAAEKIVFSTTLSAVSAPNTRIERAFDPAAVRDLKANSTRDITIGGPTLAAEAFRAGLVDECRLFLNPVIVGGGNPALPTGVRLALQLIDERRFANGVIYVRYAVA